MAIIREFGNRPDAPLVKVVTEDMTRKTFTRLLTAAAVVALLAGVVAINRFWLDAPLPEGLIQVNGRIEGDHVTVASKFQGRIVRLFAREGDVVHTGDLLLQIDDTQTQAKVDQARHAWEAIEAQVQAAHATLAILNLEVPLAIEAAQSKVDEVAAGLGKAQEVQEDARRDEQRFRNLLPEQAVARQQYEQARSKLIIARQEVSAAKSSLQQAKKELAQAALGWKRIRAKEADVAALERQRDQAEAVLAEADSVLDDLTIRSPSAGTVTTRMADVGEVVAPGTPVLELMDLDRLYLQVYVPEVQIGKVRLGLPAKIHTDAYPEQPVDATVRYIASKAEFTPKEVQTPDERVKLIYAVRLYLEENPSHRLTPGLPADAVIRWKDEVAWQPPRR